MRKKKLLFLMVVFFALVLGGVSIAQEDPLDKPKDPPDWGGFFELASPGDWSEALYGDDLPYKIRPVSLGEWENYMRQWEDPQFNLGEPYPPHEFKPAEFYVLQDAMPEGGPGLVMMWGDEVSTSPGMSTSSAWSLCFGDPDFSNVTIDLVVGAPPGINVISFGMRDVNGLVRAWYWNVPGTIPHAPPTTAIKINTAVVGANAAMPVADGFTNNVGFDPTQVVEFIVDENFNWIGGPLPVPPPNQQIIRPWNFWESLTVTPNPNINQGIGAGVNIDVHQDTNKPDATGNVDPALNPNDFHIEGWLESGDPMGNWNQPPVLVQHIDDIFPNFVYSITPQIHPLHPGMQNWYWFKADWSLNPGDPGIPYCTWLHMGLKFDLVCHNVMYDLRGWWTLDGGPVQGFNNGEVPILSFRVQDEPTPDATDSQVVRILLGNELSTGDNIPIEIVALSLAAVDPIMVNFSDLRRGSPVEEQLPWVEVVHRDDGIPVNPQRPLRLGGAGDSFFDIFPELSVDGLPGLVPMRPFTIEPGQILIMRQLVGFTDNTGEQAEFHWFWEWHESHPAQHDLGDAPDSSNSWMSPFGLTYPMTAYPWGIQGRYPTVFAAGSPAHGPIHWFPHQGAFLGRNVTVEREADIGPDQDPTNNIIPPWDQPDRDLADDGVLNLPLFLPHCTPTTFDYRVTINQPIDYFVNVWFDWNRDGDWDDTMPCPAGAAGAPEHAIVDQHINLPPGMHNITSLPFTPWQPSVLPFNPGALLDFKLPIWMRITISEQKWQGSSSSGATPNDGGSGTAAGYTFGETEDYYFTPRTGCCPDGNGDGLINLIDFAWFVSFWLQNCPPG